MWSRVSCGALLENSTEHTRAGDMNLVAVAWGEEEAGVVYAISTPSH